MKKNFFPRMLILASFAMTTMVTPAIANAGNVTLKYSNFFPPTHIQSKLAESWCQEVEKRTEGRVKVEYYPGGSLLKVKQTYDGVVDGIADVGLSGLAYTMGRFPEMSALDLPFGFPTGVIATKVANDVYGKLQPKEFADTKVMFFHGHGPGYIHTRDKAVSKLEDLKGLRIRSTGMSADIVTALGGIPVAMGMSDTYQSLQKGVVDGTANPIEANQGWKLGEVTKYCVRCNETSYTTTFFVTMNKNKWAAIDAKDQQAIEQINKEWADKHGQAWDSSDQEGLAFFQERGNVVIDLDPAETAKWKQAVAPIIDNYAADLQKKNIDGAKVIQTIRESMQANL